MYSKILIAFSTIILHSLLFVFAIEMVQDRTHKKEENQEHTIRDIKLIPAETLSSEDRLILLRKEQKNRREEIKTYQTTCDNNKKYIGIGLLYNFGSQLIYEVPKTYPAYKAGIRVGDYLVNPFEEIKNGYITINIIRGYEKLHFYIKAEKICYSADN